MNQKFLFLSLIFSLFYLNIFGQDGKLNKAKESLKEEKSTTNNVKSSRSTTSSNTRLFDENTNPFVQIFGYIFAYTAYGLAFETPFERNGRMHDAEISKFPYQKASHGNFIYTDSINYNLTRFEIYNHFFIENSNLSGNDFGVEFRFLKRFSMDVNYTTFSEKINGQKDSFDMFSAMLKYYRIRTQRFDAWFGLGVRSVFNDVKKNGFLLGFGGEIFVAKPFSLTASHKWTSLNNQSVNNTKLLLKYHINNYRITSGYEFYKLGVSEINAFSLGVEASF
ncbi:MAG: hypothetical protein NWQ17_04525 [Polaribacter sp.]|nr:hypothetical protein [Polaribacter sp.]